jgi:RNA polymerase sigma-70 factor (ECF subfamily)
MRYTGPGRAPGGRAGGGGRDKTRIMTDPNVPKDDASASRTSSSLLARAAARDPEAWGRLVDLCSPLVAGWCVRWGMQHADVQNVVQEVFAAVAGHLDRYDHRAGSFRGWLYTIARNKFIDHVRDATADVTGVGGSDAVQMQLQIPATPPDDEASVSEEKKLLYRQALRIIRGSFSETDWRAFAAVTFEAKAPREVAAELRVSVNSVYLAKSRILRKLREEFRELIETRPK